MNAELSSHDAAKRTLAESLKRHLQGPEVVTEPVIGTSGYRADVALYLEGCEGRVAFEVKTGSHDLERAGEQLGRYSENGYIPSLAVERQLSETDRDQVQEIVDGGTPVIIFEELPERMYKFTPEDESSFEKRGLSNLCRAWEDPVPEQNPLYIVLDVLRKERRANPYLIRQLTSLDKGEINTSLVRLASHGWVEKRTRGLYDFVEDPRE